MFLKLLIQPVFFDLIAGVIIHHCLDQGNYSPSLQTVIAQRVSALPKILLLQYLQLGLIGQKISNIMKLNKCELLFEHFFLLLQLLWLKLGLLALSQILIKPILLKLLGQYRCPTMFHQVFEWFLKK